MPFISIDTIVDENETVNFTTDFLNSLDMPGMSLHNLRLMIGSLVILLRNLNPPRLCYRTRSAIKRITGIFLKQLHILSGKFKGEIVLLPHILKKISESPIPH
ncbi:ATP-dependent DNA helicase [Trichonephila clavipes]|nr:ATP-dependent DNA helicase [Trichonephila clavipes]